MINFLIAMSLLFGVYWAIRFFARTPPAAMARLVKSGAGLAAMGLAALLLVRGRWDFAVAVGGVGLWLLGLAAPPGWTQQFRKAGSRGPGASRVRSAMVEMELDHDTGSIDGSVLAGPFEGRRLSDLAREDLEGLHRACRMDDPEGARLLEAYLDRRFPGWGAAHERDGDRAQPDRRVTAMSEDEAYEILGLAKNAPREEIARAHRALMKKLHPDHGGTTSLAARVNEAKDVLMRRHR
ncbi:MAG: heat shock protein DnaJ domain protein [Hyphomicrobiales bacterium]|nr:heat shock protein DnaJ domain protein [Hyphomicrobiales bacterium]